MHNKNLSVFMQTIGYDFKDISLLEVALTHSSYANEQKKGNCCDNERMEFLGDAVLELSSSDYIYKNHAEMAEGKMTRLRASIVCEPTLALCARAIKLDTFIRLGKGEELTGGRSRDSIVSDACEAVIGAIYLDGGFANAKEFVLKYILTDIEHKQLFYDSKTILQEIVQAGYNEELNYQLIREEGPDHDKRFVVEARIGEKSIGEGMGHTKKAAEQEAAYQALLKLKQQENKRS